MTPKRTICTEAKREKCRNKEARRAEQINGAFNRLLCSIPYIPETQRPNMPKIKTLRLAMRYIQHLSQLLDGQWAVNGKNGDDHLRPLQFDDFRHIADDEIKIRNTYRERAQKTEMDYKTVQRIHQRNVEKKQQRCSERLLPPQQQLTSIDPIEAFAYSTSPRVQYSPESYNDLQQQQQQQHLQYPMTSLPHVETVYGSCSPPEFLY